MPITYSLTERKPALEFLSSKLIDGSLVLFLGAGASKDFGLPSWHNMANMFRKAVSLPKGNYTTTLDIYKGLDEALEKIGNNSSRKIEIMHAILYEGIKWGIEDLYKNRLLLSVLSLLMGSKKGRIKHVVTYNYDCVLEWFLYKYGFEVNTIYNLPAIEGSEDVRIYHPHGYIPHKDFSNSGSSNIILGSTDVKNRVEENDPWKEKTMQLLLSSYSLFVGLSKSSLEDDAIAPILKECAEKRGEGPIGVWISKEELEPEDKDDYLKKNIAPLHIDEPDDISKFILEISQGALNKKI